MLDDICEWNADPWDNHRPGFDTAHAIDAFLERMGFYKIFEMKCTGLLGMALDFDRPGMRLEVLRILVRVVLLRTELIVIVISRDVFVRVYGLVGAQITFRDVGELGTSLCRQQSRH